MSAPLSRTRVERIVRRDETKELPPALASVGARSSSTVDQALIRGLEPHDLLFDGGCLKSKERVSGDLPITRNEGSPRQGPHLPALTKADLGMPDRAFAFYAMLGCTMRAMAQRKPASSRAMAVTILGLGMPR
jgi:hypothetical protein